MQPAQRRSRFEAWGEPSTRGRHNRRSHRVPKGLFLRQLNFRHQIAPAEVHRRQVACRRQYGAAAIDDWWRQFHTVWLQILGSGHGSEVIEADESKALVGDSWALSKQY